MFGEWRMIKTPLCRNAARRKPHKSLNKSGYASSSIRLRSRRSLPRHHWKAGQEHQNTSRKHLRSPHVKDYIKHVSACKILAQSHAKKAVRAILKAVIIWFNKADDAAGSVIETQEREDIMSALEGLAYAAKQPSLMDEMDAWRTW